jgi:hypothetical protein
MGLTSVVRESRVEKYEHRIRTVLNLRRDETALLCLLFLRGPQTPGELRSRADRLYSFDGLDAVESTLARMIAAPDAPSSEETDARPLVVVLPRQPGARESRYAHLLGGPVEIAARESVSDRPRSSDISARLEALEIEVASLRATLAQLEARMNAGS